jgi:hypothetical protein
MRRFQSLTLTAPLEDCKCEGWNPFLGYGDGRSEHTGLYGQEENYYECKGETAKVVIVTLACLLCRYRQAVDAPS